MSRANSAGRQHTASQPTPSKSTTMKAAKIAPKTRAVGQGRKLSLGQLVGQTGEIVEVESFTT